VRRYYYDAVRVRCDDASIVIPVHAYPVLHSFAFPRRLDMGAVPPGKTARRRVTLESKVPVSFEFRIKVLKPSPSIRLFPLSGIIPGNGTIDVLVEYSPTDVATEQTELEVACSQFDFVPYRSLVVGSSKPGMTLQGDQERAVSDLAQSMSVSPLVKSLTTAGMDMGEAGGRRMEHSSFAQASKAVGDALVGSSAALAASHTLSSLADAPGVVDPLLLPPSPTTLQALDPASRAAQLRRRMTSGAGASVDPAAHALTEERVAAHNRRMQRRHEEATKKFRALRASGVGDAEARREAGLPPLERSHAERSMRATRRATQRGEMKVQDMEEDDEDEGWMEPEEVLGTADVEQVIDGVKLPRDTWNQHSVAFVLTQRPGVLKPTDLRAAVQARRKQRRSQEKEREALRLAQRSGGSSAALGGVSTSAVEARDADVLSRGVGPGVAHGQIMSDERSRFWVSQAMTDSVAIGKAIQAALDPETVPSGVGVVDPESATGTLLAECDGLPDHLPLAFRGLDAAAERESLWGPGGGSSVGGMGVLVGGGPAQQSAVEDFPGFEQADVANAEGFAVRTVAAMASERQRIRELAFLADVSELEAAARRRSLAGDSDWLGELPTSLTEDAAVRAERVALRRLSRLFVDRASRRRLNVIAAAPFAAPIATAQADGTAVPIPDRSSASATAFYRPVVPAGSVPDASAPSFDPQENDLWGSRLDAAKRMRELVRRAIVRERVERRVAKLRGRLQEALRLASKGKDGSSSTAAAVEDLVMRDARESAARAGGRWVRVRPAYGVVKPAQADSAGDSMDTAKRYELPPGTSSADLASVTPREAGHAVGAQYAAMSSVFDPPEAPPEADEAVRKQDMGTFSDALILRLGDATGGMMNPSGLPVNAPILGTGMDDAFGDEELRGWEADDKELSLLLAEELSATASAGHARAPGAAMPTEVRSARAFVPPEDPQGRSVEHPVMSVPSAPLAVARSEQLPTRNGCFAEDPFPQSLTDQTDDILKASLERAPATGEDPRVGVQASSQALSAVPRHVPPTASCRGGLGPLPHLCLPDPRFRWSAPRALSDPWLDTDAAQVLLPRTRIPWCSALLPHYTSPIAELASGAQASPASASVTLHSAVEFAPVESIAAKFVAGAVSLQRQPTPAPSGVVLQLTPNGELATRGQLHGGAYGLATVRWNSGVPHPIDYSRGGFITSPCLPEDGFQWGPYRYAVMYEDGRAAAVHPRSGLPGALFPPELRDEEEPVAPAAPVAVPAKGGKGGKEAAALPVEEKRAGPVVVRSKAAAGAGTGGSERGLGGRGLLPPPADMLALPLHTQVPPFGASSWDAPSLPPALPGRVVDDYLSDDSMSDVEDDQGEEEDQLFRPGLWKASRSDKWVHSPLYVREPPSLEDAAFLFGAAPAYAHLTKDAAPASSGGTVVPEGGEALNEFLGPQDAAVLEARKVSYARCFGPVEKATGVFQDEFRGPHVPGAAEWEEAERVLADEEWVREVSAMRLPAWLGIEFNKALRKVGAQGVSETVVGGDLPVGWSVGEGAAVPPLAWST
jgi:hypothetical protein